MGAPLSVLIIEDSEDDVMLTLRELQRGGYDVFWERVSSVRALGEALERRSWDLVVSGYSLPGFDVTEAIDLLRTRGLDVPFIIVSGTIGEDIAVAAMKAGANDYIMKANPARLVPAVERELREAEQRRERRAALELLRQSEERYRSLINNMSDVVVCVGLDRSITYVSPQVREMAGFEPAEIVGRHYSELVAPEYLPHIEEQFALMATGQGDHIHDLAVLGADGRQVPVEAGTAPLHAADGTLIGVQAILRDVSDRRRAEAERDAAHHRLLNIIEFLPDATFVVDEERRVIAWNRAIEEMTGVPKEEVIGKDEQVYAVPFYGRRRSLLIDLIGSPDAAEADGLYDYIRRDGETLRCEVYVPSIYQGRGGYIWGIASPLYGEDGRRVGAIESVRDITARKLAESALRESEERFRRLFDGIPACCYTFVADGTIVDWNRACTAVYGWQATEAVGKAVCELIATEENAGAMRRLVAAVFRGESFEGIEMEARRADGETCYLLVNHYPLRDAHGKVLMGISAGLDVTAHKRLAEQLRQSQKMEAIGQLAGGIAHDFNNLLTVINGYSQFIVQSLDPSSPLLEDAQEVLAAGERAATMTRQLLAFSRRQVLETRALDLNGVLEGMRTMLPRLIGEHISLDMRLTPDLGYVRADPGQIEQVVINLVVNARDAMTDGGTLTIETANVSSPDPHVVQAAPSDAGYVVLSVRDTGCGLSPEAQEHLFEPFFTTKEAGAGTGLGLSTVYGIVKQSGGEIAVETAAGLGTTFRIYLPRVSETEERVGLADTERVLQGEEAILLLEDQDEVRRLTGRMLRELGYRVIEATRGSDALERVRESEETIDLVVTDVVMPEMDGRSFVEALRAVCPDFAVLYMSGYNDGELSRRGVHDGDAPFVHKPFTVEELGRKVREALDGRGAH